MRKKKKQIEPKASDQTEQFDPILPKAQVSPGRGLSSEQAAQRMEYGYGNKPVEPPSKTERQIVFSNVFTFFNLIFVVLAACLVIVGSFKDMLFLLIAIANTLIGIIQQIRSKRTIDKLTLLASPHANVVRDGNVFTIATDQLVRDDVVIFAAGNQICADAVVMTGEVQVNEALITGESDAILKKPGDALLSGSFVVSGKCHAQLERVGAESYAAKLTLEAKSNIKTRQSKMMASLDKLIRVIGITLIPLGLIMFCKQFFFLHLGLEHSMVSTVAALIGMIPEGLYLLTSVALAVSVIRLAYNKTLVHEMSCIETLARVDVLCVDKTGTITEPEMKVNDLILLDPKAYSKEQVTQVLDAFYTHMDLDNDTAKAMKAYFSAPSNWQATKTVPFTSATKWSAVVFPQQGTFVVGAPEFILKDQYESIREQVEPHSAQGDRVLLLAAYQGELADGKLNGPITPIALVLISNKIREEAPETFRFFAEQDVQIKVISGDNPLTVSQVAQKAGIAGADRYIDATLLKTQEDIETAVEQYTVFGRVTPDQKRKFVEALKTAGHTVAMTGDGVNDVLALKDADCGIAMASGSDAACQAAQLVLLDSNFSSMPKIVMEGRRVINNIERAASLFLVKNIFSFLLSVISIFASFPYPVVPLQLSLISALTIGVPAFFLALEPNKSLVQGSFMGNVLRKACPGGLTNLFIILGVELFAFAYGYSTETLSTMACICISFVGLLVLFQVCKPFDWKRTLIWVAMTAGMVVCITVFGGFFSLIPLTFQEFLVLIVFLLLSYPTMRAVLWGFEKVEFAVHWSIKKWKSLRSRSFA
ncbi:cation-translocating P-type ATPase [Solibaculum mannosilyticum]|uniref:cation-translocating P-type ATPase n=1 Tax=Solibaculum mannosilyticum TaxID=2780922 RepID=UPI0007A8B098|nr:Calcium-transporting ATPase [Eubacteriaceae bacterium CHKCI005]